MPVYDKKYIKVNVKEFVANTNIWSDKVPKEGMDHTV